MRRLVAALCVVTGLLAVAPVAHAQTNSRAVVIVSTGSGVQTRVIEFSGTVSGLEALQLAGASPETITYGPLGQAVCKLYGVGDAPVPGQCPGGWVYYRAPGGASGWNQSGLGASGTTVHDGDVEGWGYGGAPPFSSFCAVVGCAPPPTEAPLVTAPPSGGNAGGSGGSGVAVAGETATTGPGGTAANPGGETPATAAPSTTGTTVAGKEAATSGSRSGRTLAAGVTATGSSGSDGGSPVGVIVAVVVVALLVGGGVVLRRRRSTA